ncbi:hypothetical protein PIB30_061321 [Stylosanthes scabra]|uniref:Uncharacterized protein n=1 Tax=Stylosanthes scabra TaxID=79078 RepID=A0ABU6TLR7_9FABA|nr:hypothetical protein [Stylosanthes scabra]
MSNPNLIAANFYPNGELKQDADGIGFTCPNLLLFSIQRVDTLDEMKHIILRTMGAVGEKYMRRIAYRLLDILLPLEYKFKLFWLEGDDHVHAMFDLHHKYEPRQVMKLLAETRNVCRYESGPSSSGSGRVGAIPAPPLATPEVSMELDSESGDGSDEYFLSETDDSSDSSEAARYVAKTHQVHRFLLPAPAAIPELFDVSSHFHTLHLDAMQEEPIEGFGGGHDYINLDGGSEFMVGHRFSSQKAMHMAVKN